MKEKLISREEIRAFHPIFRGRFGEKLITFGMKFAGLDHACDVYDNSKHLTGVPFNTDLLDKLGIERVVVGEEILEQYKDTGFITVSNHPNGHVDGIGLIEAVASRVKNYKVMVNFILGMVDTMEENFITVSPYKQSDEKMKSISISGIKESFDHIKSGHPLGFFPAGSVSRFQFKKGKIVLEDREWQETVLRLIHKAKVPVIPIHISFRNSLRFYLTRVFLGWRVQMFALCHEFYNKKGKKMTITIGNPIMPDKIRSFTDTKALGEFLKEKTYELAKKK